MSLLTTTTNIIFPYITDKKLLYSKTFFAQGTWIDIPSYKGSWVDFGDVVESTNISIPILFGRQEKVNFNTDIHYESMGMNVVEENVFEINPTNTEKNTSVTRSSFCSVPKPTSVILPGSKIFTGLTSGDTGIIIVQSAGTETFSFLFSGSTSSFTGFSVDYKYSIYKYNESLGNFLKPPVYESSLISYQTFVPTMSFSNTLNLSKYADGEYLIKGFYVYPSCTPNSNLLGIKVDTSEFNNPNLGYVDYNNLFDWYFAYITKSPKPVLIGGVSNSTTTGLLRVETLPIVTSATTYFLSTIPSGEIQVNVNGVTIQPGIDYTFFYNNFTLSSPLLETDILTVTYLYSSQGFNSNIETYVVPSTIPSTTYPSLGEKLIYNTTTNRYEFWLGSNADGDIAFSVNGVTLSPSEYSISSSNSKRIILYFTPIDKQIFTIFYVNTLPPVLGIFGNPISVSFIVTPMPQKDNGYFNLEFYDYSDSTLSNILFSGTTNFIENESSYSISTSVPTNLGFTAGQKFWYRVKSVKNYELITGDIITTTNYSDTYQCLLNNNNIYNY
jgi:hypothetical protein